MKKCFLGFCFLFVACSTSNLLEEIEDLRQPSRYFLTQKLRADFQATDPQALKGLYPLCSGFSNPSELANCACREHAVQNIIPNPENFRALLSTSSRHFACNLQDINKPYCQYKIRPTRDIYFVFDCPFAERHLCVQNSPTAHSLQSLLEEGPLKPIIPSFPFLAAFDASFNTVENCLDFTTSFLSENTRIWNESGIWQRGGTVVFCDTIAAIFCLDKY